MADHDPNPADFVVIPEQQLRGSRQKMLASIDEAITGLLALRHLIGGAPLAGWVDAPKREVSTRGGYLRRPFTLVGRLLSGRVH